MSTTVTLILEKVSYYVNGGHHTNSHTKIFTFGHVVTLSHWDPVRQKELLATTTKMVKEFFNSHKNGHPYHTVTTL